MSCLIAKAPNTQQEQRDPWMDQFMQSCVSMLVEHADKYEDKDVDADQTRMGRPVGGQVSTQLEEIDIDFRVPGLSHAVVKKQKMSAFKSSSRRSKVIIIEKHIKPIRSRITSTTHSSKIRKR